MGRDAEKVRELLSAHDPAVGVSRVERELEGLLREQAARPPVTDMTGAAWGGRTPLLWAGAALAAGAVAATAVVVLADGEGGETGGGSEVTVGSEADDALPSVTGTDWVTHADQVAVVRPTAEKEIPASAEEKEAGEGYIGRSATLSLERVLWSRAGASAAPESVTLDVAGWTFKGEERHKFAVRDAPRIEIGHSYIVALAREDDGSWSTLGSSAVLPYDGGTIGSGESEGVIHSASSGDHVEGSVEEQMTGKTEKELAELLRTTRPAPAAATG
ncbi:hypothetical protein QCN29_03175 [Streptomyces sp. HNM0663]|uniref:Anti-sigma factor n=1 Tax=Streptomyces chengmaiensis TaxID=3040919 RepID=A0ABT6HGB0_9ACTN|nr:hypothetical protein [Streptomyces chengmaiensis]MDH2387806.1 hypothetical protein [Streptomyces chengmaiensis]